MFSSGSSSWITWMNEWIIKVKIKKCFFCLKQLTYQLLLGWTFFFCNQSILFNAHVFHSYNFHFPISYLEYVLSLSIHCSYVKIEINKTKIKLMWHDFIYWWINLQKKKINCRKWWNKMSMKITKSLFI